MVAHEKQMLKQRLRRKRRVRKAYRGTPERPRLTVFRSNKHIYCQLIDDVTRKTICAASTRDKDLRNEIKNSGNTAAATTIGRALGEKAVGAGIKQICFDRGPYQYHGRVKALAESVREAGLKF